ncbi:TPA: hypothetical protein ACH3X1_001514 [Trebouxia sp. C0004]
MPNNTSSDFSPLQGSSTIKRTTNGLRGFTADPAAIQHMHWLPQQVNCKPIRQCQSGVKVKQSSLLVISANLLTKYPICCTCKVLCKACPGCREEEEEEGFYKILPANTADHLCQSWPSCSDHHEI